MPNVLSHIRKVIIHIDNMDNMLAWKYTNSSMLSLKDAYNYIANPSTKTNWTCIIWNIAIHLSQSIMVCRLINNKMPTDENLMERGRYSPSICNLCHKSTTHIFLQCPFDSKIWIWLQNRINHTINPSFIDAYIRVSSC